MLRNGTLMGLMRLICADFFYKNLTLKRNPFKLVVSPNPCPILATCVT